MRAHPAKELMPVSHIRLLLYTCFENGLLYDADFQSKKANKLHILK